VHDAGATSEGPKLPLSNEARSTVEEKEEDPAVTIARGSADQAAAATEETQLGN